MMTWTGCPNEDNQDEVEVEEMDKVICSETKVDTSLNSSLNHSKIDLNASISNSFEAIKIKQAVSLGEMVVSEMTGIDDPKVFAKFKLDVLQVICKLNSGQL